jgi:phosphate transport system permease protein
MATITETEAVPGQPPEWAVADRPRQLVPGVTRGDRVFRLVFSAAGLSVFALMALILVFLSVRGYDALHVAGWSFLTETQWVPEAFKVGIGAALPDGLIIAVTALVIAVPVALTTAVFISEYAPPRLRRFLISVVDLMAAVPSIIYGLWGFAFLTPRITGVSRWLSNHLGNDIPFLKVRLPDYAPSYQESAFIAGVVVSLMAIPIITSLSREVFSQAPIGEREGAYALGATRWGMVRTVVLPFGRGGALGAIMLGFGRAVGETIAVALVISPVFTLTTHPLEAGANSIPSLIVLRYGESNPLALSALMAAGLVLFGIVLLVNMAAAVIIGRSRSGAATNE